MTLDLEKEILALRSKRLTPKQIARKLGLRVSQVSGVIKANAQKSAITRAKTGELAPVAQCCLNTTSFEQLLSAHEAVDEQWETEDLGGLAMVLVARTTGYERFVVCTYLVDYWCLGLKDTLGPKQFNGIKYREFLQMVYRPFPDGYQDLTLEQAQAIIYGGINYAASLGFSPHRDFEQTKTHLGSWSGQPQLKFGRQGKPFFISGPYDDPTHILEILTETVGEGNFDYLIGPG